MTASKTTIVVVEDDLGFSLLIRDTLVRKDYLVAAASGIAEGWRMVEALRPALVVTDVGLPDGSGVDLCRRIRTHRSLSETPVIMLTGMSELEDKERGFDSGADHYLVKPFDVHELTFWVASLLKRAGKAEKEQGVVRLTGLVVDPGTRSVNVSGRDIDNLTPKEFELLYQLARSSPRILAKDKLSGEGSRVVVRDNTVEVHIRNLRAKLGDAAPRIVTVPGAGYRLL